MTAEDKDRPRDASEDEARETPPGDFPEVMTVKQAAEYLQVNEQVLYRYVREGKVPVARMGATIRFKKSVLDEWLTRDSWDSIGVTTDRAGKPRTRPSPSRPDFDVDVD